jgi:hypothetical protein
MVKELGPALNQVDMTVGGRIEGAGIEGSDGHGVSKGILRHLRVHRGQKAGR